MDCQTGCRYDGVYGEGEIPGIGQLQEGVLQLGDWEGAVFGSLYLDPCRESLNPDEGRGG